MMEARRVLVGRAELDIAESARCDGDKEAKGGAAELAKGADNLG
jgi:hypothetical protein